MWCFKVLDSRSGSVRIDQWCWFAEVDSRAHVHGRVILCCLLQQGCAIEILSDSDRAIDVVETTDDAPEGFQRTEGVQRRDGADVLLDGSEGGRMEE